MIKDIKTDYRIAAAISAQLSTVTFPTVRLDSLQEATQQCERWQRRLDLSSSRRWHFAAADSLERLCRAVELLHQRSLTVVGSFGQQSEARSLARPQVQDIYAELRSVREEFESVSVNRKEKYLSVRTAEIVLEDLYLGCFDIRLYWEQLSGSMPYQIVSVEGNHASRDEDTSHPHVQNEQLCEGEGATVIRRALQEGRPFDFFCVVDRILQTYNPDSAYIAIEDWRVISCGDCGCSVDRDESYACEKCSGTLCDECTRRCTICSDCYCTDCVSSCHDCDDDCCQSCLQSCDDCKDSYCPECLTKGICHDCHENQKEAQEAEAEQASAPL